MGYKVLKYFTDLQDNGYPYKVGDNYPREGLSPSPTRVRELSGRDNAQGIPLIKVEPPKTQSTKKAKE